MLQQLYNLVVASSLAYTWPLVIIAGLLVWRLYKFVLLPHLNPSEPKPLPYLIPFLGHTLSFITNSEHFLSSGKERMGGTDTPYAITLGGRKVYVINDPKDVGYVYRSSAALSFEGFLRNIVADFGISPSGVEKLFQKRPSDLHPNSNEGISVAQAFHKMQVRQGQGKDLRELEQHVDTFFQNNLFLESMMKEKACQPSFLAEAIKNDRCVTLKGWTAEVFINCTQNLYFGEALAKINPRLPQMLREFDDLSWQVFYGYPKFLRGQLSKVAEELIGTFRQYLKVAREERGSKAWFMGALEDEYRAAGLVDNDIASQFLFLYWGITTNASKTIYWMMVHILYTPGLMEMIREETKSAFQSEENHDIFNSCPKLDSLWNEVLRVTAAATAVRTVETDIVVGGKLLKKGNTTLMSARALHYRETEFGEDVKDFDPDRFEKNPHLRRSPAFRPFGGGITQCPGRFLARYMVFSFVALVLHRYDVSLAMPQPKPQGSKEKPAVGIVDGDRDLLIRFKERCI